MLGSSASVKRGRRFTAKSRLRGVAADKVFARRHARAAEREALRAFLRGDERREGSRVRRLSDRDF